MEKIPFSDQSYLVYVHEHDYSSKDSMMMVALTVEMTQINQLSVIDVKHDSLIHFEDEVEQ